MLLDVSATAIDDLDPNGNYNFPLAVNLIKVENDKDKNAEDAHWMRLRAPNSDWTGIILSTLL